MNIDFNTYNPCPMDPSPFWRWFECHPGLGSWVQGLATVIGIITAIGVPWAIHLHGLTIAREPQRRARKSLRNALVIVLSNASFFRTLNARKLEEGEVMSPAECERTSDHLAESYQAIRDAIPELSPLLERSQLEEIKTTEAISDLIKFLEGYRPTIEREIMMLRRYNLSSGVITSSLSTGEYLAENVLPESDEMLRGVA